MLSRWFSDVNAECVQTVCVISSAPEEDPADVLRFRDGMCTCDACSMQEKACLMVASGMNEKWMEKLPESRVVTTKYILRCGPNVVCKAWRFNGLPSICQCCMKAE